MTTVIGLPSGKEFVVEDGYYPFIHKVTGLETDIFISPDHKRMITVPSAGSAIEFYDEPATEVFLKHIQEDVNTSETEVKPQDDPNVR